MPHQNATPVLYILHPDTQPDDTHPILVPISAQPDGSILISDEIKSWLHTGKWRRLLLNDSHNTIVYFREDVMSSREAEWLLTLSSRRQTLALLNKGTRWQESQVVDLDTEPERKNALQDEAWMHGIYWIEGKLTLLYSRAADAPVWEWLRHSFPIQVTANRQTAAVPNDVHEYVISPFANRDEMGGVTLHSQPEARFWLALEGDWRSARAYDLEDHLDVVLHYRADQLSEDDALYMGTGLRRFLVYAV